MKTRFSTIDISAALSEINERAVGLRLVNVYDVDHKTYLFKLSKTDLKIVLLIESGVRIHLSEFDWPKNNIPSGFAMKMRKHLRGRRLVSATQLGSDRIVDLQFGSDDAAYHVILELYDRGNIALTDHEDIILNLLRFRKDQGELGKSQENDDVRCAVHEHYPRQLARPVEPLISIERLRDIFQEAKKDALLKRFLIPYLPYGAACIDHCLSLAGFGGNVKVGKEFVPEKDLETLYASLSEAEKCVAEAKLAKCKGFIIQKSEKKLEGELLTNVEFHPFLFDQHRQQHYREFLTFNEAVDEFYSSMESQKHDLKALQREKTALRKLENVRRDHDSRLLALRSEQDEDRRKASVIEKNLDLVDQAIRVICSAIANQVDWDEIRTLVIDAQAKGDIVALSIKSLKLETNAMVLSLTETGAEYDDYESSDFSDEEAEKPTANRKPIKVEIDLSISAYANAQKYYNKKRQAAQKEQRTMDASKKAFKSAEKKTAKTLKEVHVISNIQKARKTFWFEKFLWFISSENYLVLGGRDAQQNELLVKKYLRSGDVYVHADLHGATSCIIKNNSDGLSIPPKTLNEAGTMAICHSAAWDAKVVTSAWWVRNDQVSKTAPSGEYLTTGSFLIRGKKNYLPPSYLVYGFGFLFKVDETCVWKHKGERKVKSTDDDVSSVTNSVAQMEELAILSDDDVNSDSESKSSVARDQDEETPAPETSADAHASESSSHSEQSQSGTISSIAKRPKDDVNDNPGVVEQVEGGVEKNTSIKSEEVLQFPDTKMTVRLEDKYQLDTLDDEQETNDHIYLGDDNPVKIYVEPVDKRSSGKSRMSAKQKRELKKLQRQKHPDVDEADSLPKVLEPADDEAAENKKESNQTNLPYVRGQKKKLARLRRKQNFEDDDDSDKKLMMEMLQASKPAQEKKKRKNKKVEAKDANAQKPKKKPPGPKPNKKQDPNQKLDSDEERELALKEEHLNLEEVNNALDSLTGMPAADDVLLFAIPVCAPYNTMQNYKFKVKLTPGPGKKGKAAKTAINIFQSLRETTALEKDHFRSVKDNDLSRNMPGKVKVSAPNMQKLKAKKR